VKHPVPGELFGARSSVTFGERIHSFQERIRSLRKRICSFRNYAFPARGRKFPDNRAMLEDALRDTGFAEIEWCPHGRSNHAALCDLERHERSRDTSELPHLLIVEAFGRGEPRFAVDRTDSRLDLRARQPRGPAKAIRDGFWGSKGTKKAMRHGFFGLERCVKAMRHGFFGLEGTKKAMCDGFFGSKGTKKAIRDGFRTIF
jgi:hypothetical protein